MDAVSARSERHPLRAAGLVAGGIAVVAAGAALILYLWLGGYAPLDALGAGTYAPGPGLAADVEPVPGSGGKPVFVPSYRGPGSFDTAFTVHNSGRFAVTVLALDRETSRPEAASLLTADSPSAEPGNLHAFRHFRLDAGDTATIVVRWQLDCAGSRAESYADSIRLRYRYLSLFTRTERIRLPFAVTLRCGRGSSR
jgi:hypothetical protein